MKETKAVNFPKVKVLFFILTTNYFELQSLNLLKKAFLKDLDARERIPVLRLQPLNQSLQSVQMFLKSLFTFIGGLERGVWTFADEGFSYLNVFLFFQCRDV